MILSNEPDERTWAQISPLHRQGASILGILASIAAYREGAAWLDEALSYLDANRRLLSDLCRELLPGVGYEPPEATYLAWLDLRALELSEEPAEFFLASAKVALGNGASFGAARFRYAGLNFATSGAIETRIVRALSDALEQGVARNPAQ